MKNIISLICYLFCIYSSNSQNKIENNYEIPKGFYILNSIDVKSNNYYRILTLEKNEIKKNGQHNSNEIVILQKKQNKYHKIFSNKKIIFEYDDNCPADGFGGVVSKSNYFTIQQIFCQDFLFVNSYTTFKINEKGKIILHKYGEEYTNRNNPNKEIANKVFTPKDFGEINFENVSEDFILKLRQGTPEK